MFARKLRSLKHVGHRLGQNLLLCTSAVFLLPIHLHAAEQVTLTSNGVEVTISIDDLQGFVGDRQTSAELQQFFEQTGNVESVRQGLDARIPLAPATLEQNFSSPTDQFVLVQLDQILGTQFRQENLRPLQSALVSAYENDSRFSVAEVIEHYPTPEVRVEVSELLQVYNEMQPIVAIANNFLPELACNCIAPTASEFDWSQTQTTAQTAAPKEIKRELDAEVIDCMRDSTSQSSYLKQNLEDSANSSSSTLQQLIVTYGPLRPSFSIEYLEALAESGEAPRAWSIYLNAANVEPEIIQTALNQTITVEAQLLDRILNSVLGEYGLFQLGQILHTRSERANIQALRAAIVQSVLDDNRISLLEFLQNYPLPEVYVDGSNLIRLSRQFNQTINAVTEASNSGIENDLVPSEDWLLSIQASIAENLCECSSNHL
ncbi:alpha/beta hydrolase [Leptolyngbya sp. FACHB-541]|uniref:alpha/beta hydrolase n=1 Tax=Leptolyngbya sp. FACHB-541 TaxID=2692810 RepID=UPI001682D5C7|nr:alpha/beta hydrolase [Leptolyngbya sp. FACHB-541]MBD1999217.1 alpha/beta hydrolase [Leptolyngbya sp. FACHB-541]